MSKEKVILVDKKDVQLGLMPKMEAHRKGVLHRAFSVFIFNSSRELLMQKKDLVKNTILQGFGLIHAVVIKEMEKAQKMLLIDVLWKKWD